MQYEIGISRYGDNKKNVCGSAFIIFNENMKVENIRILRSKEEELYVAMPHYKDKEGNYQDYCFPITKEFRDELYGNILKAYEYTAQSKSRWYQFNVDDKLAVKYEAKAYLVEDPQSMTKGIGTVVMDGCFAFSGITLRKYSGTETEPESDEKKELYVSFPAYPSGQFTKDNKQIYKNHFYPIDFMTRRMVSDLMMKAYQEAVKERDHPEQKKAPEKKTEKRPEKSR
ncbi:regulatory protein SpoVG [uncultured Clostridium sp.]|uniref:SpoVG family protein n=1 Tax=Muricoprocola aceti TaxID=2981772 RepID=A0ABT2SLZ7_9FIRM|nr:SpoVG family protein [Muricoprocola aceti]MCU6725529.1 SpoVG family protein [Muricoprocola aceti]SCH54655.1 regulatory protein SpoVG [uncultured Clostridium sp.]